MTIVRSNRGWLVAAALVACVAAGCGNAYDATVTGIVTLEGAAVPQGTIAFIPVGSGPTGYGVTDAAGAYSVVTGREEGLPAGEYTVTVAANEPSTANANPSLPPNPGKPITPEWYRDVGSTPLKKEVKPGDNDIPLELSKDCAARLQAAAAVIGRCENENGNEAAL